MEKCSEPECTPRWAGAGGQHDGLVGEGGTEDMAPKEERDVQKALCLLRPVGPSQKELIDI